MSPIKRYSDNLTDHSVINMLLKLVISLALCHLVCGQPQKDEDAALQEAISNLQLLNQIMIENTVAEQTQLSKKLRKPIHALSGQPFPGPSQSVLKTLQGNQKVYSLDGPFSDIPSDAFKQDHRKEFRPNYGNKRTVTKKDLNRHAHKHTPAHAHKEDANKVPESLIQTCLDYFQGRSQPKQSSLELILDICTELLDTDGSEDFAFDDKTRQKMYDFRTDEGTNHHHHTPGSVECECCPYRPHSVNVQGRNDDDSDTDVRSDTVLNDIMGLFKPVGNRREWMVVNSQNPDERLRTYIDLKKNSLFVV